MQITATVLSLDYSSITKQSQRDKSNPSQTGFACCKMECCVSKEQHLQTSTHPVVILPCSERPTVSKELAIHLAEKHYDIQVEKIIELKSYGDRNFYLQTSPKTVASREYEDDGNSEFVLKILNYVDSSVDGMVEAQNGAMLFLKQRGIACSGPVLSSSGHYIVYHDCSPSGMAQADERDKSHDRFNAVRLMQYVPGEPLGTVEVLTNDFLFELGVYIGKMDKILKDYTYPGLDDKIYSWDLRNLDQLKLSVSAECLGNEDRASLITNVYDRYFATVPRVLQNCSKQVIHNDVNEANVIVIQNDASNTADTRWSIAGVIDFGDLCYTYRVFEIAIAMAHIIIMNHRSQNPRPLDKVGKILQGYHSVYQLSEEELSIIYWCIAGRLIQIIIFGSKKKSGDPDNNYVDDLVRKVWKILPEYLKFSDVEMLKNWMKN